MNELELKPGIFCRGLNEDISSFIDIYCDKTGLIYSGKTSDIPEEIAKECVKQIIRVNLGSWDIYSEDSDDTGTITGIVKTAKEFIQSALTKDGKIYEFVIIYKK